MLFPPLCDASQWLICPGLDPDSIRLLSPDPFKPMEDIFCFFQEPDFLSGKLEASPEAEMSFKQKIECTNNNNKKMSPVNFWSPKSWI
jgi:hypothetical protein